MSDVHHNYHLMGYLNDEMFWRDLLQLHRGVRFGVRDQRLNQHCLDLDVNNRRLNQLHSDFYVDNFQSNQRYEGRVHD